MTPFLSHQKATAQPRTIIQPKLMVNAPNDVYEQEADSIADRVMRMPLVSSKAQGTQGMLASSVQRKCAHCEEEEKKKMPIMRKAESGGGFETSPAFASQLSSTRGGGQAMPSETKGFMESRFGRDFSHVRLHTDGTAADMSTGIQAKAFTHGSDIYFNRGEFSPNTEGGRRLLAHELVHTVQQNKDTIQTIQRQTINDSFSTPASERGPLWDAELTILNAPDSETEALTSFRYACHDGIMAAARAMGNGQGARSRTFRVRMRYRNQLESATEQEAYRLAIQSVSIPQPSVQPPPVPTPVIPVQTPLTVVSCSTFPITIGSNPGGCGTGDDAMANVMPLTAVPNSVFLQAIALSALTDNELSAIPQATLLASAGSDGFSAFDHFFNSSASSMTFSGSDDVATRTQSHSSFLAARTAVETALTAQLTAQAAGNVINCSAITLSSLPSINLSGSSDIKLWALIGGTQGLTIELTNVNILPLTRAFSADIKFKICDDFGVDVSDLSRTGARGFALNQLLLPFWILQHRRSGHTPLVMNIEIDDHVLGNF